MSGGGGWGLVRSRELTASDWWGQVFSLAPGAGEWRGRSRTSGNSRKQPNTFLPLPRPTRLRHAALSDRYPPLTIISVKLRDENWEHFLDFRQHQASIVHNANNFTLITFPDSGGGDDGSGYHPLQLSSSSAFHAVSSPDLSPD